MTAATISPYLVEIPDAELEDLHSRLRSVRWPDELANVGWDYGVPRAYLQDLVEYWCDGYDWRTHEARLNEQPQFLTTIDGQRVHFLHIRSPEPDALPEAATYWLTGTVGSSIRRYYEDAHATGRPPGPTTTPTGVAIFAQDFQSVRRFSERDHANIVSWNRYPSGSHFATRDATDLLISDIRGFYRPLR